MNYEELLETRDARKTNKIRLPYGFFYKRLIDGKYSNFVEFHDELADNILFNECVRRQCDALGSVKNKHQLHFTPNQEDEGIYALAVEPGNYITFEQLLNDSPSVVARKDFLESTIRDLVEMAHELHEKGIQYLCFAPSNILVRKTDNSVRLLLHGSFFLPLKMQESVYDGLEDYIAPEVMANGTADSRSDVYSLGRFIAYLYESSGVPFELKHVLTKATAEAPEDRYATVDAMLGAMTARKNLRRSVTLGIAAVAIALIVMGIFFEAVPNTEPVEFVKPVKEPINEDLLDDGFDPLTELGPDADSATIARAIQEYMRNDSDKVDEKKIREFEAKAEQIFRKQYSAAADQILSKIYNNERMNNTEKNFQASSAEVMKELVKKQEELSSKSSISGEKAQRIASEIIEQITEKKKAALEAKAKEKEQEKNNQE
jgi:serine/threonine protein kinase